MKILAISDTHSRHKMIPKSWLENKDNEISVLVHGGDISMMGYIQEVRDFCEWFSKQPFDHLLFTAGNHDYGLEPFNKNYEACMEIIKSYKNITYLADEEIIIDGVKFYFSPQSPYFYDWAFNCARDEAEAKRYNKPLIKSYWDKISLDTQVLITHGPVYGLLDMTPRGEFVGCKDLLDVVATKLPKLSAHICGHIHCAYGKAYRNNTQFINASTANEQYLMVNEPILIEI